MSRVLLRTALVAAGLVLVLAACTSAASVPSAPPAAGASQTAASVAPLPTAVPVPTPTPVPTATPAPSGSPAPTLAGTWNGTWQDVTPDHVGGTFVLTWTQNGSVLMGGIVVNGTPCLSVATVTGTVSGSTISFGAVSGTHTVVYNGTISGTTMKGSYVAPAACVNATGTWAATKK